MYDISRAHLFPAGGWWLATQCVQSKVHAQFAEVFSVQEFLACCTVSVPELERVWGRKKGVAASQAKESFKKFLGNLLVEKRNAPSLKAI